MTPAMDVKGLEAAKWRYSINYGPDGEANYAFVYDSTGALVSNFKTHHAIAVVDAMNAATLPPDVAGLVAEWEKAAEGVTPGPWRPSSFGFQVVSDFPEAAWQSVVELRTIARSTPHAKNEMESQRTIAAWIARSSPAGIRVLLDTIKAQATALTALSARGAKMRVALEPFVREALDWDERVADSAIVQISGPACDYPVPARFTVGDLRRARLASGQTGDRP